MYDRILVPTDGSEGAERAIKHALSLAEVHGATVHGLYAVEPVYSTETGTAEAVAALEDAGERAVASLAEAAEARNVAAVTEVRRGTPHQMILDYAEEEGIDVIVMGTEGRTGLSRYLVGSVAEKVVRLSDVPVLTVRAEPAEE